MWKKYDFECEKCKHIFDDLVNGTEGKPDFCPACGSQKGFVRQLCAPYIPTKIIVDYPGSKRLKAGYVHTHGDRLAEKKGSQVSMHGTGGVKKK